MGTNTKLLTLTDLRGGMNNTDPPMLVGDRQVVDAVNVDYYDGGLCRKRGGETQLALVFGGAGFSASIFTLMRHLPSNDEHTAELWGVDSDGVFGRRPYTGGTWINITPSDAQAATPVPGGMGVSFNGKLFMTYDSAVNRLHCWDGTSHRRVGLATPAAPTAADSGSGAYAATIRYYKVSYAEKSGTTVVRRSELSPVLTKTPSGSGTGLTITKPAAITEGETHWELWGSEDNLTFYFIAATVVGTTTYVDSSAPSSYSAGAVEPVVNSNLPPPSCKYLATDGNRLFMAGAYETSGGYVTPKKSRVWFTPVLGALDIGDDERIPLDHYIDVGENDGTSITGLAFHDDAIWIFKSKSIWKLIPTGNAATPYTRVVFDDKTGALQQRVIVSAVNHLGASSLYFLSAWGLHRIAADGLVYLGRPWKKTWDSYTFAPGNLEWAHGLYYEAKHQLWWWVMSDVSWVRALWVYDIDRDAWSRYTGTIPSNAQCSIYYGAAFAAPGTNMKPMMSHYLAPVVYTMDASTYSGENVQAYITTKPYALGGIGRNFGLGAGQLVARASAGTTITVTASQDYGLETRTSTVSLSPEASETSVVRKLEGMDGAGLNAVQFTIGDDAASASAWTLDALVVPYDVEEPR